MSAQIETILGYPPEAFMPSLLVATSLPLPPGLAAA
jgi:hypothetical protein